MVWVEAAVWTKCPWKSSMARRASQAPLKAPLPVRPSQRRSAARPPRVADVISHVRPCLPPIAPAWRGAPAVDPQPAAAIETATAVPAMRLPLFAAAAALASAMLAATAPSPAPVPAPIPVPVPVPAPAPAPASGGSSSEDGLRALTAADFNSTTSQGMWFVEFFSPFCPRK